MAPSLNYDTFIKLLKETCIEQSLPAVEVLLRCTSNILQNPNEPKYRRIKISCRDVTEKLIPVKGALECLFFAGFSEGSEHLIYPHDAPTVPLQHLYTALLKLHKELVQIKRIPAVLPWDAKTYPPGQIQVLESAFNQRIVASVGLVQLYEDADLQKEAKSRIPVDQLLEKAERNLSTDVSKEDNSDRNDSLLLELLAWFKDDFFRWFDAPHCSVCSQAMVSVGQFEPTAEEIRWGGNRVEGYRCEQCGTSARFPRYNHPRKLLDTKVGRCGEWANCFTLCCRALGFEARYVLDWTDHVWTEVYSLRQNRWLHCDPCENICDKPLVYEAGWNKKLTYVLAFSKDDVQDVTWRYSSCHSEVLQRRLLCRESWLLSALNERKTELQLKLDAPRRKELERRLIVELVEFLGVRSADQSETKGRISGSVNWRRQRGEQGTDVQKIQSATFKLTEEEVSAKKFHLKYSSATDTYVRVVVRESTSKGWESGVHNVSNVFRKVETDWKQAYLARTEGSEVGLISWKVSTPDNSNLCIVSVSVKCNSAVYEDGNIIWTICARDNCIRIPKNEFGRFTSEEFAGEKELTISAELSGGRGDVAWQHAQLFRQSLQDTSLFPFDLLILYK